MMRECGLLSVAGGLTGLLAVSAPASAQVFVTSITAALPDSAGKVPGFNKVPGAAIASWSNGLAQAILMHGQAYNYCVSLGSGVAKGKGTVSFRISRGTTTIQTAVIIPASQFPVGPNGIWYLCSGYTVLPTRPGPALLTGTIVYTATGSTAPKTYHLSVPLRLK